MKQLSNKSNSSEAQRTNKKEIGVIDESKRAEQHLSERIAKIRGINHKTIDVQKLIHDLKEQCDSLNQSYRTNSVYKLIEEKDNGGFLTTTQEGSANLLQAKIKSCEQLLQEIQLQQNAVDAYTASKEGIAEIEYRKHVANGIELISKYNNIDNLYTLLQYVQNRSAKFHSEKPSSRASKEIESLILDKISNLLSSQFQSQKILINSENNHNSLENQIEDVENKLAELAQNKFLQPELLKIYERILNSKKVSLENRIQILYRIGNVKIEINSQVNIFEKEITRALLLLQNSPQLVELCKRFQSELLSICNSASTKLDNNNINESPEHTQMQFEINLSRLGRLFLDFLKQNEIKTDKIKDVRLTTGENSVKYDDMELGLYEIAQVNKMKPNMVMVTDGNENKLRKPPNLLTEMYLSAISDPIKSLANTLPIALTIFTGLYVAYGPSEIKNELEPTLSQINQPIKVTTNTNSPSNITSTRPKISEFKITQPSDAEVKAKLQKLVGNVYKPYDPSNLANQLILKTKSGQLTIKPSSKSDPLENIIGN